MTPDRIVDRISQKYKDLITAGNAEATPKQWEALRDFLMSLFPYMDVHIKNSLDFNEFLSEYGLNPYAECCIIDNHIIIPNDLKNVDYLIEEFLHPFIEILYNDRKELFDSMLQEAKKDFALLEYQINESYSGEEFNSIDRDKELITQALSRYFRNGLGKNKNTHKGFDYFIKKFIGFVKDLLNLNRKPEFPKTPIGTRMIPISSLENINGLAELAEALNTEGISFDTRKGFKKGKVTYHITHSNIDETKYDVEKLDAHRTAIYRKQDFIIPRNDEGEAFLDDKNIELTLTPKIWQLYKDFDCGKARSEVSEYYETYGENADLMYDLTQNYTSIDIEQTEQQNKQERLVAIYDDR